MELSQASAAPQDDLYEPVRRHADSRRGVKDKKVVLTITLLAVFFVGMILSFWWFMSYWDRYTEMCSRLSDSTDYAYRKHTATVDDGSAVYALADANVYELYQCVCVYGPAREKFSEPKGETVTVDYGNGSSMRLVQTGSGDDERLYFCFRSADGFSHTFYTSEISLDYMMRRYLSQKRQL